MVSRTRRPGPVPDWGLELTADEAAYAAAMAGRTSAETVALNAEWAVMSQDERDWLLALEAEFPTADDPADADAADTHDADTDADAELTAVVDAGLLELAAAGHEVSPAELATLASLPPAGVSDPGQGVAQLAVIDRLSAWAAARRYAVVGALSGRDDSATNAGAWLAEAHLAEEISLACRVGSWTAQHLIDTSRLLAGPFAAAATELAAGRICEGHVRTLVAGTVNIVDDPPPTLPSDPPGRSREDKLAEIGRRVAHRARVETPGRFRASVAAAVCAVDAVAEADRRAQAVKGRDVYLGRPDQDGMGALIDTDCASRVAALHAELSRRAKVLQRERGGAAAVRGGDADARIGACRADALAAAILGTDPDHPDSNEPAVPALEGHLVIDLPTLQGLVDHPCLLNGQPIPAPVGRELAASVKAWRRFVTDPVTGHLLDYGTRCYLPEPLLRFTAARDQVCAAPYCERPASRCWAPARAASRGGPRTPLPTRAVLGQELRPVVRPPPPPQDRQACHRHRRQSRRHAHLDQPLGTSDPNHPETRHRQPRPR